MKEKLIRERLWTKDYIIIMMACFGTAVCNYFFFTALPLYAEKITGSNVYSGLMLTAYSAAALAARPFSGVLSDRYGRVRQLIIGALICAVACALYGMTTSVILLLAIRVINGLGFGMHSTCGGAVAADVVPKSRLAEGIGYFGLYGTLAGAFAPGIALGLVGRGAMSDYRLLFFISSGVCLMSMVFDCMITYERKGRKEEKEAAAAGQTPAVVPAEQLPKTFLGFEYAVFLPAAVLILLFFASSSINTFLTLFAQQRAMGNIGLYYTVNAAGLFLSRILFGRLTDRRGADIVVIPGMVGIAVCTAAIPFAHSIAALCVIALPLGLASGAVYPSINSMMFKRSSPQRRGTASAAYFAAIDIGYSLGGFAFGFVADGFGYSAIYWIAAGLTAGAFFLYIRTVAEKKPVKAA